MERKVKMNPDAGAMKIIGAATCALFFSAVVDAQTRVVERDVTGAGLTEQEAVLNALQEATFQICGIRIESKTETHAELIEDGGAPSPA